MAKQPAADRTFALVTPDDLVTGEAVALDLPPAGLATRMTSGLVDVLATLCLALAVVFTATLAALRADGALMHVAWVGTLVTVFVVFPTVVETLTRGRSLGKLVTGLRTVRDDGGPISAHHAFVRALVGFVEIYALSGAPAFFSALLSPRGKRLGDHAAGTYVVRERVRLTLPPPVAMPPALAAWARTADIAPLPTGLALAARQFLGRADQVDPASRHALAIRLADEVRGHVAPPPPPGTPAEELVAAVLAARRERDVLRLQREARLRERLQVRR